MARQLFVTGGSGNSPKEERKRNEVGAKPLPTGDAYKFDSSVSSTVHAENAAFPKPKAMPKANPDGSHWNRRISGDGTVEASRPALNSPPRLSAARDDIQVAVARTLAHTEEPDEERPRKDRSRRKERTEASDTLVRDPRDRDRETRHRDRDRERGSQDQDGEALARWRWERPEPVEVAREWDEEDSYIALSPGARKAEIQGVKSLLNEQLRSLQESLEGLQNR
jgi:hypothetical protein